MGEERDGPKVGFGVERVQRWVYHDRPEERRTRPSPAGPTVVRETYFGSFLSSSPNQLSTTTTLLAATESSCRIIRNF